MGDVRYDIHLERLGHHRDRARAIHDMDDEAVISALGAASKAGDPLLANVLTTEILNRVAEKNRIIAHIGEGVFRLRPDGTVAYLNDAAARILGREADGLLGRDLHEVIHVDAHGEPLPRGECAILRSLSSGLSLSTDRENFLAQDGRIVPADCTATPILRDGEIDGVVVIFRDATPLVQAQAQLRASEQHHRELFDDAPSAYFEIGLDERIMSANAAAHQMLHYAPGELVGRSVFDLHPATGPWHDRALELFERFASGRDVINEELEMVGRNGEQVWVSLSVKALRDSEGRIIKARVIVADVTAERARDDRLRELADFVKFNPSPVFRVDAEGTIRQANPAAYDYFGDDHLVGKRWASVCPEGNALLEATSHDGVQRTDFIEREDRRLALTYRGHARTGCVYVYGFALP